MALEKLNISQTSCREDGTVNALQSVAKCSVDAAADMPYMRPRPGNEPSSRPQPPGDPPQRVTPHSREGLGGLDSDTAPSKLRQQPGPNTAGGDVSRMPAEEGSVRQGHTPPPAQEVKAPLDEVIKRELPAGWGSGGPQVQPEPVADPTGSGEEGRQARPASCARPLQGRGDPGELPHAGGAQAGTPQRAGGQAGAPPRGGVKSPADEDEEMAAVGALEMLMFGGGGDTEQVAGSKAPDASGPERLPGTAQQPPPDPAGSGGDSRPARPGRPAVPSSPPPDPNAAAPEPPPDPSPGPPAAPPASEWRHHGTARHGTRARAAVDDTQRGGGEGDGAAQASPSGRERRNPGGRVRTRGGHTYGYGRRRHEVDEQPLFGEVPRRRRSSVFCAPAMYDRLMAAYLRRLVEGAQAPAAAAAARPPLPLQLHGAGRAPPAPPVQAPAGGAAPHLAQLVRRQADPDEAAWVAARTGGHPAGAIDVSRHERRLGPARPTGAARPHAVQGAMGAGAAVGDPWDGGLHAGPRAGAGLPRDAPGPPHAPAGRLPPALLAGLLARQQELAQRGGERAGRGLGPGLGLGRAAAGMRPAVGMPDNGPGGFGRTASAGGMAGRPVAGGHGDQGDGGGGGGHGLGGGGGLLPVQDPPAQPRRGRPPKPRAAPADEPYPLPSSDAAASAVSAGLKRPFPHAHPHAAARGDAAAAADRGAGALDGGLGPGQLDALRLGVGSSIRGAAAGRDAEGPAGPGLPPGIAGAGGSASGGGSSVSAHGDVYSDHEVRHTRSEVPSAAAAGGPSAVRVGGWRHSHDGSAISGGAVSLVPPPAQGALRPAAAGAAVGPDALAGFVRQKQPQLPPPLQQQQQQQYEWERQRVRRHHVLAPAEEGAYGGADADAKRRRLHKPSLSGDDGDGGGGSGYSAGRYGSPGREERGGSGGGAGGGGGGGDDSEGVAAAPGHSVALRDVREGRDGQQLSLTLSHSTLGQFRGTLQLVGD